MAYDENIYARIASGEVSQEEIDALKKSGEWDQIQSILQASESLTLPAYDKQKGFEDLMGRRASVAKINEPVKRKLNLLWVGMAASVLLVLGFLFLINNSPIKIQAALAKTESANFPDGSSFVLNDGSAIEYNNKEWSNSRQLNLTGEALFDVEKGGSFIVNTINGHVEVLGTKFNVRSWGDKLYVECYEGSVKVSSKENESILLKNEALNIVEGKMQAKSTIQHSTPLWQSGTIRFHEEKLNEVFKELERQYDVKLEYVDAQRKFSGFFEEGDLEKALRQVCDPMGLKFEILQSKKVIITD